VILSLQAASPKPADAAAGIKSHRRLELRPSAWKAGAQPVELVRLSVSNGRVLVPRRLPVFPCGPDLSPSRKRPAHALRFYAPHYQWQ
jgi:hypothetical protein